MLDQMAVEVPPRSNLSRALTLARKWLVSCTASHATCMDNSKPDWYPTRLLEIEPRKLTPMLIETKACQLSGGYACLSHCWGSLPITRLLRDNYDSFRKGIDPALLPKTFCDAIEFCKELGLRYLWIDSLCIIQDSLDDWREESNMMCQVYRNSTLCLSAAGAADASKGLYFDRKIEGNYPFPQCPAFLSDRCKRDTQNSSYRDWYLVPGDFYTNLCAKTYTFDRAWIFQERFLATRVLHFGRREIFWECCTANYCETFPEGVPQDVIGRTDILPKATYERIRTSSYTQAIIHPRIFDISSRPVAEQMQMTWEALITEYTRCDLSNLGDKLIALSGMAQSVWLDWRSKLSGDVQYLAGVWNIHLPHALLWACTRCGPRPAAYIAPTWSWASTDGQIDFQLHHWKHAYEFTSTILDVRISYVKSCWGQVKDGHIWVKGPIRKINWLVRKEYWIYATHDEEHPLLTEDTPSKYGIEIVPDEDYDVCTQGWGELHALLVMRFLDPGVQSQCVLVLNPVNDQCNTFHRVGIMSQMSGVQVADWFDGVAQQAIKII